MVEDATSEVKVDKLQGNFFFNSFAYVVVVVGSSRNFISAG